MLAKFNVREHLILFHTYKNSINMVKDTKNNNKLNAESEKDSIITTKND